MKQTIKDILREQTMKNMLGILVTRPKQELIIMRGISGGGKSTKAKSLVGEGVIHSTDALIEATGDYRGFFEKMIASKNFIELSRMHSKNLSNAKKSMDEGISPVIIDNTNLTANESKAYVKYALEIGFANENIKVVDVGTGGLVAEALAARNTHGVPLDKIKQMMAKYKSTGELTLKRIMESKDMYPESSDVLYSAVVLDEKSHKFLLGVFEKQIPTGWTKIAHHMTIVFGKGIDDKKELGKKVKLLVTDIGRNDKAMAVLVEGYPSKNAKPHITLAVNPDGGKPQMSNDITEFKPVAQFPVTGVVTEVKK